MRSFTGSFCVYKRLGVTRSLPSWLGFVISPSWCLYKKLISSLFIFCLLWSHASAISYESGRGHSIRFPPRRPPPPAPLAAIASRRVNARQSKDRQKPLSVSPGQSNVETQDEELLTWPSFMMKNSSRWTSTFVRQGCWATPADTSSRRSEMSEGRRRHSQGK